MSQPINKGWNAKLHRQYEKRKARHLAYIAERYGAGMNMREIAASRSDLSFYFVQRVIKDEGIEKGEKLSRERKAGKVAVSMARHAAW